MPGEPKLRVLVAKPGLDGHDRGAKIIARALRDAGMEVIYTGLRSNVEAIVQAAIQEDVDLIGLSMLSGAHKTVGARITELLKARDADIPVIMGGVIPGKDHDLLKSQGIAAIFGQEDSIDKVVGRVRELALAHHQASRAGG
jgi:methylmalonyl-CoA mutase C-terminal domain/subunit